MERITYVDCVLTRKLSNRLERPVSDKRTSLFQIFVTYRRKEFFKYWAKTQHSIDGPVL
jgi:hypothetical protein